MARRMMGMVGMLALTLAACARDVAAPVRVDVQQAHLATRAQDLAASVTAAGRMSEESRVELLALERDVEAWQALRARDNAGDARATGLQRGVTFASRAGGGSGGTTCSTVCVPVQVRGDLICFLTHSSCIGGLRTCYYDCFVGLGALPAKRV